MKLSNLHNKNRITHIDLLRGISIFFMIFLHTSVYYIQNSVVNVLFNVTDFVNVAFIFCSSYIYLEKNISNTDLFKWEIIKHRLIRLLIPYYIFLVIYFITVK